jgi:hypothetical protein
MIKRFFKNPLVKTIEFRRRPLLPEEVFSFPTPALQNIPKWYKDMSPYSRGGTKPQLEPGNSSPKACMPVFDALTAGYVFLTPFDIEVRIYDNPDRPQLEVGFKGPNIIKGRTEDLAGMFPGPLGFTPGIYIWHTAFEAITPPGYSVLYTHPLNQEDLPFRTSSGIMDNDVYGHSGSIPFYVKKGWEGIIPQGTPFLQLIPFKRESWKGYNSPIEEDEGETAIPRTVVRGFYRDKWWQKKIYK